MKQLYQRINEEVDKVESAIQITKDNTNAPDSPFTLDAVDEPIIPDSPVTSDTVDVLDVQQIHPNHSIDRIHPFPPRQWRTCVPRRPF